MSLAVPSRRIPPAARILLAMLVGGLCGWALGPRAEPLGQLGTAVINLIKALAAPLLVFAILDAFLQTRVRGGDGARMVGISLFNASLAILIGLTLSNLLRPGDHLKIPATATDARLVAEFAGRARKIDPLKEVLGYVPSSVVEPFVSNAIVTIILLTVLAGAALRRVKDEQEARGDDDYRVVESFVSSMYRAVEVMMGWVILLVPLAVFGVVAKTIGQHGLGPLRGLAAYVGVAALGMLIQVGAVYQAWLVLVSRMPLRRFWAGAREPVVYALGASSSLATLPVTLRSLDRMGVSPRSARLAACVGTNLNNDGILLYEAMAVLFVAQVYGIRLSIGQQVLAAVSCMIAGVGIAGVPDAGLISLSLVLTTVGLPIGVLPLLLTVDWVLSRCRAMTNVVSDLLVAVLLDRFGGGGAKEAGLLEEELQAIEL